MREGQEGYEEERGPRPDPLTEASAAQLFLMVLWGP